VHGCCRCGCGCGHGHGECKLSAKVRSRWQSLISSASGTERGEEFYGPMDWLGSCDPMTHYDYAPDSSSGLDDQYSYRAAD
jgi:hypothetical protein